ncbi:hypothetical protein DXH47_09160 [Levilactobacillus suantsaii]|uniref:YopX protein domain-containing protein n=2 Tax=Levilactobacillus suantsaii TaxID=2292255 RepID=A0A4Q0VG05_9LACO|nr:hypothetical protein DXH47_09160 [Levilactobacillus suantsaii]
MLRLGGQMMFRAYIEDTDDLDYNDVPHKGHFVYGNLIEGGNKSNTDAIVGDLIEINDEYVNVEWWCSIEKGSAEQYTGLKDANGNSTEKFRHTEKGVITNLYQKLKKRNKNNGFGSVPFSLKDFYDWSMKDKNFHRLFRMWVFDNYSKISKPSVDRIDPTVGYEFDNMQWLSWNENYYKGIHEVAEKKEKPVDMYKDGIYIGKFKFFEYADQ